VSGEDRNRLAAAIEHTLLKQEATGDDIRRLCDEAAGCRLFGVCVQPIRVGLARSYLDSLGEAGRSVTVSTVAGFPLGCSVGETVAAEAAAALDDGAAEVDMVISLGLLLEGDEDAARDVVEKAAGTVHERRGLLKVILESAALSDEQNRAACRVAGVAGADFVKTSTGMHPAGGASVHHVQLLKEASGLRVKAAGGIRDTKTALAMLEAGADRLGTSSGVAIVEGAAN